MSIRVRLCGRLRLIWIDTLRRVHNVDFLTRHIDYCQATPLYGIRFFSTPVNNYVKVGFFRDLFIYIHMRTIRTRFILSNNTLQI